MLDEVLYMEVRILRAFCERHRMDRVPVNRMFNENGVWGYIESCYDLFHTCGDEYVVDDITDLLRQKGVVLCS